MVKHTQTIRQLLSTNCLNVFNRFVVLALKRLRNFKGVFLYIIYEIKSLGSINLNIFLRVGWVISNRGTLISLNVTIMLWYEIKEKNISELKDPLTCHNMMPPRRKSLNDNGTLSILIKKFKQVVIVFPCQTQRHLLAQS